MFLNGRLQRGVLLLVLALLARMAAAAEPPPKVPEFVPGSWSLVLLPDTQIYAEKFPGLFVAQTAWIARNKDKYDIRYVLHLGDITNGNTQREWRHVQDAFAELDGKVPYALAPGNHDYTPHGVTAGGKSGLNEFFPVAKFKTWPTFGGTMKDDESTNTFHLFSAGGTDWIVLALEWAPRDATVEWANQVLAKHPKRKAILVTHAYLYEDGTRYDAAKAGPRQEWSPHQGGKPGDGLNDGEELWQKLVRKNNFALTFNGHVLGRGVALLASKNDAGKTAHQMLVNYQMRPQGGEAYLRILEFLPDGRTVHVKSYSPLHDNYLQDAGNQFNLELDP